MYYNDEKVRLGWKKSIMSKWKVRVRTTEGNVRWQVLVSFQKPLTSNGLRKKRQGAEKAKKRKKEEKKGKRGIKIRAEKGRGPQMA